MESKETKQSSVDFFALARISMDLDMLTSNSDLSYRIINNADIVEKVVVQSKLDGCIIKNSKIINSNFSRCDINVARIENCTFIRVDFSSADIISSIFSNCDFIECTFEEAHISDCEFFNTKFDKVIMTNCSFLDSTVKNSKFIATDFSSSTIILNKYYCTSFNDMSLGNTTFEYHIMRDCEFNNITINTDSLAYMYGCKENQLHSVKLIFLGKEIEWQEGLNSKFFNELYEGFVAKHWYLGALLLKMNYKFISIYEGLNMILELFIKENNLGFLLKGDELRYIINILYEQYAIGELPSLVLETFIERINSASNNNTITTKNKDIIEKLCIAAFKLKESQDREINSVCRLLNDNFKKDNITAELVFKEKPIVSPLSFLSFVNQQYGTSIKVVGERNGSYIVDIISELSGICLILSLLKGLTGNPLKIYKNGILLKSMINKEFRNKYKQKVLHEAIQSHDKVSINQNISITINHTTINIDAPEVTNIVILPNCGGYDCANFIKVNIID